ncbi:hypothetical protein RHMOL_Rhmol06G0269600 [Rhododendron molle]|uniref:Uncharacterized protein n=4 Tax=Rhododendron molle TaxID=49168 RepID=A0ACC0NH01_RHOML|nr:hypothetical protein RHMOL_Rhmol06G0269600 [Rhododendron molle]KAI8552476.1 hypothetical protein RHMOL_Rhmol06G0269600 [Rhododendron molle]KAI8552478.1 hypothetical protein RHMOL_Rhmol06G0269600 [Rhododendron molle]
MVMRRMAVHSLPINPLPNTPLSPLLYYMVYCTQFQASTKQSSYGVWLLKNKSPPIGLVSPFTGIHAYRAGSVVDTEEASDLEDCFKQKLTTEENTYNDNIQLRSSSQSLIDKNQIEQERRRKISLANKGKESRSKGRKHGPETRERISRNTKAALMDPKIRAKMSGSHVLSDESKARISYSLTRVWGRKLKWKRSRAKFLSSWADSIAEAAKRGGNGQRELHWDSYDKIKEEIAIEQRRQAEAKEMAKEKKARVAQKRKVKERKETPRGEMRRKRNRKSKEEREELDIAQELKINERLAKLHKRKTSTNGQISSEDQQAWEKLDLEFVKKEQIRRQVSLADQIRAAKAKRVEHVARERLPTAHSLHSESDQQSE